MPWSRLFYHLVWSTAGREPIIDQAREQIIHDHMRAVANRHGIIVHAIGGTDDHVHLAVSIPPTLAVATAVQRIKGGSSRAINEEFMREFRWQAEYGVDTFSKRHLGGVVGYISHQRQHHADGSLWASIEPHDHDDATK
ncbi:MAG: IS200/IS605 family transposase [Nitrolancea sp.]